MQDQQTFNIEKSLRLLRDCLISRKSTEYKKLKKKKNLPFYLLLPPPTPTSSNSFLRRKLFLLGLRWIRAQFFQRLFLRCFALLISWYRTVRLFLLLLNSQVLSPKCKTSSVFQAENQTIHVSPFSVVDSMILRVFMNLNESMIL